MFLNNSQNQINPKLVILRSPFLSAARHLNILLLEAILTIINDLPSK